MHTLFLKWTLLVWINAAVSFALALSDTPSLFDIYGIATGVFSWVFIYTALDFYWQQNNRDDLRKALLIGVGIKALTQLLPAIEMMAGILAREASQLILPKITFVSSYLTTVIDGALLSLIVAFLMIPISLIQKYYQRRRTEASTDADQHE